MCALEPTAQGRVVPTAPQIAQPPPPPEPWLPPPAAPSSGAPSKPDGAIMRDSQMEELLTELKLNSRQPKTLPTRGVFATRALDLRQIKCIGYDMDYTLIDYKMVLWEERAYHYSKEHLRSKGFPVSGLRFDPELVCRGLVIDKQSGNMVKVDRFGYVRRAMHGTRRLSVAERHSEYGRLTVDLRESRWAFLNTLFSVSEGCLYAQLVDRLDSDDWLDSCAPPFDEERCRTYEQLHKAVTKALFRAHVQSQLKDEVMSDPGRFMNTDPAFTQTLLEQRCAERASDTRRHRSPAAPPPALTPPLLPPPLCSYAGKKLALITNSDWVYTKTLMQFAYAPFLPPGMSWQQLFDVIVVSAYKPEFFTTERRPVYEIVQDVVGADGSYTAQFGAIRAHFGAILRRALCVPSGTPSLG